MSIRRCIRELWAVVADALACGDWREHLAAWWAVAIGAVRDSDRAAVVTSRGAL